MSADLLAVGLTGHFVDCFLYRTQLYLVTLEGHLLAYNVADFEDILHRRLGSRGDYLSYCLFHSRGLGSTDEQREAWWLANRRQGEWSEGSVDWIDIEQLEANSHPLGVSGYSVLDVNIYYDTIYLATNEALLDLDATELGDGVQARPRLTHPCLSTSASLGSIAVACGKAGLTVLLDEFGWAGAKSTKRYAVRSIRTSFAGASVVNYSSSAEFQLYEGEYAEVGTRRNPRRALVALRASDWPIEQYLASVEETVDEPSVQYSFNRGATFYSTAGGKISRTVTRKVGGRHRHAYRPRLIGEFPDTVVSAELLGGGLLLETGKGISFLEPDLGVREVYRGRVISVRVFKRSHRYQGVAAVTTEDGLLLVGAWKRSFKRHRDHAWGR